MFRSNLIFWSTATGLWLNLLSWKMCAAKCARELRTGLRERLKRVPITRRYFGPCRWHSRGDGVYWSYREALEHISTNRAIGYNSEEAANMLRSWPICQYRPSDYALFFHLRPLLTPGRKLVDLGGSVGISYYVLQQYMMLPEQFDWLVCELPALVKVGREMASARNSVELHFTDQFKDAEGCEILISSGSLQYQEDPLADLLSSLHKLPSYLLINRIPIWDRKTVYTLQRIGSFTCVYKVMNRAEFVNSISRLGYRLVTDWLCAENEFSIRFHPEIWLSGYHGFYFSRIENVRKAA